ncbi:hypothetical protein ERX46_08100 [Brumimicrobium glaciale]|uniref:Uncharacterized protein n=1 Tax=Brumimicrobium glaciale TaxID=200475 RepID=A0A4Q4KMD5_9FLAO|nr:hypothetical protein [Brumimicrobium glaciale]RYM33917.1 hypothetical protein ERX46_08100 [Brumimicrobium glaciale]
MVKKYSEIKFEKLEDGYKHNLDADFGCFVLWESTFEYRSRVRNLLNEQFEILLEVEIEWSEKHLYQNACRLYEAPFSSKENLDSNMDSIMGKIGGTNFILFVIKDNNPIYTYAQSVSKKVELSNLNIVEAKYKVRGWIENDLGLKNAVHSTNNIYEFYFQAPLLLNYDLFERLVSGEHLKIEKLSKDLEGANGWKDYDEFFRMLNLTSNYLIQRGFEDLFNIDNDEKELDILTDSYQRLASVLGAEQIWLEKPHNGVVSIANKDIILDIRYIGDFYYDTSWQRDMLNNKVLKNKIFIPREDDYFFSLLYHCKAQKPNVKKEYIGVLNELAKKLRFEWFYTDLLTNDETIGKALGGYYIANDYYFSNPVDQKVYRNLNIIKHLPSNTPLDIKENKSNIQVLKSFTKKFIPQKIKTVIKKMFPKRYGEIA